MKLAIGEVIDQKYRVLRLLGKGAMGTVYEGENLRIHRRVAIKVLHADKAENPDIARRFEREAQAAARIGSPHIVDVFDLGDLPNGKRYMVMELLEGESLHARIRRMGRMPPSAILPIMLQLLDGLAHAHAAGVIHRDLKPSNVILVRGPDGHGDFVKIVDFGVSKFQSIEEELLHGTGDGVVIGTPCFVPPEIVRGQANFTPQTDLYALGVMLYRALSGHLPYSSQSLDELLLKIGREEPTPLEAHVPHIDPSVLGMVRKAMARDPEDRFQAAQEFASVIAEKLSRDSLSGIRSLDTLNPASGSHHGSQHGLHFGSQTGSTEAAAVSARSATPSSPSIAGTRAGWRGPAALAALIGVLVVGLAWARSGAPRPNGFARTNLDNLPTWLGAAQRTVPPSSPVPVPIPEASQEKVADVAADVPASLPVLVPAGRGLRHRAAGARVSETTQPSAAPEQAQPESAAAKPEDAATSKKGTRRQHTRDL